MSTVSVIVRISCEFKSLQGILRQSFFPSLHPFTPQKLKPRTSVESGAQESFTRTSGAHALS